MKHLHHKLLTLISLLTLLCVGVQTANAATLTDVMARVDEAFAAGQITDADLHDELITLLQDAQAGAAGSETYKAFVDAFRVTVSAHASGSINATTANEILDMASGL